MIASRYKGELHWKIFKVSLRPVEEQMQSFSLRMLSANLCMYECQSVSHDFRNSGECLRRIRQGPDIVRGTWDQTLKSTRRIALSPRRFCGDLAIA